MSDPRPFWQQVERTFDYRDPVRNPAWFAERDPSYDPLARLERRLRRPSEHQKYLVTGTVGNGKTSALFHLSANLATERMVVFFDVYEHFVSRVGDRNALEAEYRDAAQRLAQLIEDENSPESSN